MATSRGTDRPIPKQDETRSIIDRRRALVLGGAVAVGTVGSILTNDDAAAMGGAGAAPSTNSRGLQEPISASAVTVEPVGSISSTSVQNALGELDGDIAALPELATSDPAKVSVTTVGGVTTLNVNELAWRPVAARLTGNSNPVNNSTTLINAVGLAVSIQANAIYLVQLLLFYRSGTVADLRIGWSVPAGVSGQWTSGGMSVSSGGGESAIKMLNTPWVGGVFSLGGGGALVDATADIRGALVVGGTAGTLQFQFAQNTADVSDTTLRAHSLLVAQRVA
jgi:hypothetical protein